MALLEGQTGSMEEVMGAQTALGLRTARPPAVCSLPSPHLVQPSPAHPRSTGAECTACAGDWPRKSLVGETGGGISERTRQPGRHQRAEEAPSTVGSEEGRRLRGKGSYTESCGAGQAGAQVGGNPRANGQWGGRAREQGVEARPGHPEHPELLGQGEMGTQLAEATVPKTEGRRDVVLWPGSLCRVQTWIGR